MKFWKNLTKKQTRELLKQSTWILDSELSNKAASFTDSVYINSDGKILMGAKYGSLFESKKDFVKYIAALEKAISYNTSSSLLSRILPQGQNFLAEVPQLINELVRLLKISRSELNYSLNSLNKVDRAIRQINYNVSLQAELFAPLVAYVGEVLKQAMNGCWELRLSEDGKDWEPWIIDNYGDAHPPFTIILKQLLEEDRFSIQAAIAWEIQAYELRILQEWG